MLGLLDGEKMVIKPEGFDLIHGRGGGMHRLRGDSSKWIPLRIGEGEKTEDN